MDIKKMNNRKGPAVTVDAIVEMKSKILLIKRRNEPYKDRWALPGGFVEYGESVEEAIKREVKEEADIEINLKDLIGVYSEPGRDPRGHVVTVCFQADGHGREKGGSDAKEARLFKLEEALIEDLAFDHNKILDDYVRLINVL